MIASQQERVSLYRLEVERFSNDKKCQILNMRSIGTFETKPEFMLFNRSLCILNRLDRMSALAVRIIVTLGYTNIWRLEEGMVEWERAGFPLVESCSGG